MFSIFTDSRASRRKCSKQISNLGQGFDIVPNNGATSWGQGSILSLAVKVIGIFVFNIFVVTPISSLQTAAATTIPPNPTDTCTVNWYRWRTARVASRQVQALNPTTHGYVKSDTSLGMDTWYEQSLTFVPGIDAFDNIPNEQLGRSSLAETTENSLNGRTVRTGEAFYGVFKFELEPNSTTTIPLNDPAFVDGHAFMAFDRAGNALARFPSVDAITADGSFYIAANSQAAAGAVDADGIDFPSVWNDNTFEVDVPSDGLVYVHYTLIDEGAAHRHALRYCPQDVSDAPVATYGQASHTYDVNLLLGNTKDVDLNVAPNATATGDDVDGDGASDEDGVSSFNALTISSTSYSVDTDVTNNGSVAATLYGWVDFDNSGTFDNSEMAAVAVPAGTVGSVTLNWTGLSGLSAGDTFARFRLTTDTLLGTDAVTPASDGEVEDYALSITAITVDAVDDDFTGTPIPSSGGITPSIFLRDTLNGSAVTALTVNPTLTNLGGLTNATIDGDGFITVPAGTAPDTYTQTYQICEQGNSSNCDTALAIVRVNVEIIPDDDNGTATAGFASTPIANVTTTDTINGTAVVLGSGGNAVIGIAPGSSIPTGFSFNMETGSVSVEGTVSPGEYTFDYQLCDTNTPANCETATVSVVVGNEPPVANDDSVATQIGEPISVPVFANDFDPEGRGFVIQSVTQGSSGEVTFTPEGTIVYTPNPEFNGVDEFAYTICDEFDACDTATVIVTIDEDSPTAVADSGATSPETPIDISLLDNDSDPNGDVLVPSVATPPGNGSINIAPNGVATYTPAAGFNGVDTFEYQVCDSDENCDTALVTVVVSPNGPKATDEYASTTPGVPVTIAPLNGDTDPNDDPLMVTQVTQPANGTIALNSDGAVTYAPNATFQGVETIVYTVCDTTGLCDKAAITIDVRTSATLAGKVFLDTDGDDLFDSTETTLPGYIVEVELDEKVVAETVADTNGLYEIEGLAPNDEYDIIFRDPETEVAAGVVKNVSLAAGENVVDQNLPIDPSGIVYDIATGDPIIGATVTIFSADGALLPAICLIDESQQNQETGSTGFYGFDLVPGADAACPVQETEYTIGVVLSNGSPGVFGFPPQVGSLDATTCIVDAIPGTPCEVSASPLAPVGGGPISFYTSFLLESGDQDVINNHLPISLPQSAQPLSVTKTANVATTQIGGIVLYTIRVTNDQAQTVNGVDVVDAFPAGFAFVKGSARVDGQEAAPLIDGRRLLSLIHISEPTRPY